LLFLSREVFHPQQRFSPASPRVERVSTKYFSSKVHPTSGLDEFS
jgi:hypothetical protein